MVEKVISFYKGHFLIDEEEFWIMPLRQRLKNRFIRLIIRLGNYLEETGQWEKAVENYQRALDIDDLTDEFYQRLMICYHQVGQRTDAIAVYQKCKNRLSSKLGIEPFPKTEAVYRTLI